MPSCINDACTTPVEGDGIKQYNEEFFTILEEYYVTKKGGNNPQSDKTKQFYTKIKDLLNKGADLNCTDKYGISPLQKAIMVEDRHLVRLFLARGATQTYDRALRNVISSIKDKALRNFIEEELKVDSTRNKTSIQQHHQHYKNINILNRNNLLPLDQCYELRQEAGGAEGQLYEIYMLALVLFRLLNNEQVEFFKLGANIKGLGQLDDIVIKIQYYNKKKQIIFVQLKHHEYPGSGNIKIDALEPKIKATGRKNNSRLGNSINHSANDIESGPFTLQKNFLDYLEIKKKFSLNSTDSFYKEDIDSLDVRLVLYTPRLTDLCHIKVEQSDVPQDDLLRSVAEGRKISFLKLQTAITDLAKFNQVCVSEVEDFLKRFWLYSNQGSYDEIEGILFNEISEKKYRCNDYLLTREFLRNVEQYWLNKNSMKSYLDNNCNFIKGSVQSLNLTSMSFSYGGIVDTYKIKFNDDAINSLSLDYLLNGDKTKVINIISDTPILSCIKTNQYFDSKFRNSFIFLRIVDINDHDDLLEAFCNSMSFHNIVMFCITAQHAQHILSEVENNFHNKNIVIISDFQFNKSLTAAYNAEKCSFGLTSICDQNISLADLDPNDQDGILNKYVQFQGKPKKLIDLVGGSDQQAHVPRNAIDAGMLLKLLNGENCTIFKSSQSNKLEVMNSFVDREITCRRKVDIKILHDNFFFTLSYYAEKNNSQKDILILSENRAEFDEMCQIDQNRNIHWLAWHVDHLIWKESVGQISRLRPYLCSDENFILVQTMHDLQDNATIIAAKPGMGKSTILTALAEKTKQNDTCLVIRINLLDKIDKLKDMPLDLIDIQKSLEFIFQHLADSDMIGNKLRRGIFERFLEIGKTFILFDGFDEISPNYKEIVLQLLRVLKDSRVGKLLITTRSTNISTELEDGLGILAHNLKPFTHECIKLYFKKVLSFSSFNVNEEKLNNFVSELINFVSQKVTSHHDYEFLSVPLHCEMVATCCKPSFERFCKVDNAAHASAFIDEKDMNLITLFESFVSRKFEIYWKCKCKTNPENTCFDRDNTFKQFESKHKRLALILLFEGDVLNFLLPQTLREKYPNDLNCISEKEGVLCKIVNGIPQFVHRTFAEYFTALALFEIIKSASKPDLTYFFKKILLDNLIAFDRQQICLFIQVLALKYHKRVLKLEKKVFRLLKFLLSRKIETLNESFLLIFEIIEKFMATNEIIHMSFEKKLHKLSSPKKNDLFRMSIKMGFQNLIQMFKKTSTPKFLNDMITTSIINAFCGNHQDVIVVLINMFGTNLIRRDRKFYTVNEYVIKNARYGMLSFLLNADIIDCNKRVHCWGDGLFLPLSVLLEIETLEILILLALKKTSSTCIKKAREIPKYLLRYSTQIVEKIIEKGLVFFVDNECLSKKSLEITPEDMYRMINKYALGFNLDRLLDVFPGFHIQVYLDLLNAVQLDNVTVVHKILEPLSLNLRSIINATNHKSTFLLIYAILNNNVQITEILITNGANLDYKVIGSSYEFIKEKLTGFNQRNCSESISVIHEEATVLHYAAELGFIEIVKSLYQNGADINAVSSARFLTPLHCAAANGHKIVVEYLVNNCLQIPIEINALTSDQETPLYFANKYNLTEIAIFLRNKGAFVEELTSVQKAAVDGDISELKRLIEVEKVSSCGKSQIGEKSLFHVAVESQNEDIIHYLIDSATNKYALLENYCSWDGNYGISYIIVDYVDKKYRYHYDNLLQQVYYGLVKSFRRKN